MKMIQKILIILLMANFSASAQSTLKSRFLKPSGFQEKVIMVTVGKNRSYYALNTEKESVITVRGPGILRVLSRGIIVSDKNNKIKYHVLYTLNGGKQNKFSSGSVYPSKQATYSNTALGVPSQLKDFEIELGRGNHTIEFVLGIDKNPVVARFKFTPTKAKKQKWIGYSPITPCEPIELISRESTVKYYRFSFDKPLKVKIIGPTELRVLTRIENHYNMKGRILYRIQVKENDKAVSTYQMSSRRSEVAVYKEDKNLIPGKACEFVIDVPKGKHVYEIVPLDKNKSTILGRCLIPEKDVSLKSK